MVMISRGGYRFAADDEREASIANPAACWVVEYWNPGGHETGEAGPMTWEEATSYADGLLEMVEPEDVDYVITSVE